MGLFTVTSCICEVIYNLMFIDNYLLADSVVILNVQSQILKDTHDLCSTASGFWLKILHL